MKLMLRFRCLLYWIYDEIQIGFTPNFLLDKPLTKRYSERPSVVADLIR
jgi:hypothetical protein